MLFEETNFNDLFISLPIERVNQKDALIAAGQNVKSFSELAYTWSAESKSLSDYGQISGLHYQTYELDLAYLISVSQGKILCVVVDLRLESETYSRVYSTLISSENKRQILVPRGFAHGYSTLSDQTTINYKSDQPVTKNIKHGIIFNDPKLDIDWLVPIKKQIISKEDQNHPLFKNHRKNLS